MLWKTLVWGCFAASCLFAVYWFLARPWLARQPALRDVYAFLSEHEAGFFAKARVSVSGLKREFFSRLVWLASVMIGIHDFALPLLGLIDIQPLIPEPYRQYYPVATAAIGMLFEYLTKISPTPVGTVNPDVIAGAADAPIAEVAAVTAPDPVVAAPVVNADAAIAAVVATAAADKAEA
jgi:hypothetical protein